MRSKRPDANDVLRQRGADGLRAAFDKAGRSRANGFDDGIPPLCQSFVLRPEEEIPPRQWLYAPWCIRGFVSMLDGRSGVGKTTLYIGEAMAIATGRNLLGVQPVEAANVWIFCFDDQLVEVERRIAATAAHHHVTNDHLQNRLYVDGMPPAPLIIGRRGYEGLQINTALVDAICSQIERRMIGLLIIDPLAGTHAVSENDNGEMNAIINVWRGIAARTDCAILLVHHGRKGQIDDEAAADASRGASAVIDAVRTARMVRAMTGDEAEKLNVPEGERRQYARLLDSKTNLAAYGKGSWVRITQVLLRNGDSVGAIEAWKAPDELEGVGPEELDRVVAELTQRGPQRESVQSPQWLGWLVADVLALKGAPERSKRAKTTAKAVIETLAKAGRIRRINVDFRGQDRPSWEAVA